MGTPAMCPVQDDLFGAAAPPAPAVAVDDLEDAERGRTADERQGVVEDPFDLVSWTGGVTDVDGMEGLRHRKGAGSR
jgi:hypothetical protein